MILTDKDKFILFQVCLKIGSESRKEKEEVFALAEYLYGKTLEKFK